MNLPPPCSTRLQQLTVAIGKLLHGNVDDRSDDAPTPQDGPGPGPARFVRKKSFRVVIPFLARLDDLQLLTRTVTVGRVSFFLSLGTALIGLATPTHVERIVVGAIVGLVSTAMWKLLAYPSFLLLGTALVASSARVGRPFRWAACALSGVAFDLLTAGLGVFTGILPAITIELGWRGLLEGLSLVAFALTGMGALRLPARMLYGLATPQLLERRWLTVAMGLFVAGAALAAANAERWPELAEGAAACDVPPASPVDPH